MVNKIDTLTYDIEENLRIIQKLTEDIEQDSDSLTQGYIEDLGTSDILKKFVRQHNGVWNHDDWLVLVSNLKQKNGAINELLVGRYLEREKEKFFQKRNKEELIEKTFVQLRDSQLTKEFIDKSKGKGDINEFLGFLNKRNFNYRPLEFSKISSCLEVEREKFVKQKEMQEMQHEFEIAMKDFETEKMAITEKKKALSDELEQLQKTKETILSEIFEMQEEIKRLDTVLHDTEMLISNNNELKQMRESFLQKEDELKERETKLQQAETVIAVKIKGIENVKLKNKELENNMIAVLSDVDQAFKEIKEAQTKISNMYKGFKDRQNQIKKREGEISKLKAELVEQENEFQEKMDKLKTKERDIEYDLSFYNKQREEVEKKKREYDDLSASLQREREALEQKEVDIKEKEDILLQKREELEQKYGKYIKSEEELQESIGAFKKQNNALRDEKAWLAELVDEQKTELNNMKKRMYESNQKMLSNKLAVESMTKQKEGLTENIRRLNYDYKNQEIKFRRITLEISKKKRELDFISNLLEKKRKAVSATGLKYAFRDKDYLERVEKLRDEVKALEERKKEHQEFLQVSEDKYQKMKNERQKLAASITALDIFKRNITAMKKVK